MNVQPLFIAPTTARLTAPRSRPMDLLVHPAAMKLSNATPGGELAIVGVADAAPALLAYLAEVGLAANTRITVQKHRSNSAVMTIQIRGQHDAIHLGSVASDALWVERTAA